MASGGDDADGTETPQQVALYGAVLNFLDVYKARLAQGEVEDENFVLVDGDVQFGGLPADVAEAAKMVGQAWGVFDGEILPKLVALFVQVEEVCQRGTRAQFPGCTAWERDGTKCNAGARAGLSGERNRLFNLCKTHLKEFRLFASWLDSAWGPVQVECTNCSAEVAEGELTNMPCFTCARGIHSACLVRAVNMVEPGKLSADFGDEESDYFVCPQCVASDWAKVVMMSAFILGQMPNARFVVAPPDDEKDDAFVLEDFSRLQRDAEKGLVPSHIKVAVKPVRQGQATGGAAEKGRPNRRFRGGSVSGSRGSIPTVRRGRREPTQDESGGPRDRASSETGRPGQSGGTGGTRGENLRRQGGGDRAPDLEGTYEYFLERMTSEGKLPRRPPQGAGMERTITLKLIQGEHYGVKTGEIGAFDCAEAHAHEVYHGQGFAMGPAHAKKMVMILGFDSVSSAVQTFDPESKVKRRGYKLVDGSFIAEETGSLDTPLQYTWLVFVDGITRLWIRVAASGLGVFDPAHPEFEYFSSLAHLIVHRYFLLVETGKKLQQGRQAVHWEVAWRYILAFIAEYFAGVLPTDSALDLQLMNISEDERYRREVLVAALVKIDPHMLQAAKDAATAAGARASGSGVDRSVTSNEMTVEAVAARVLAVLSGGAGRGGGTGGAGGGGGGGGGSRPAPAPGAGVRTKCPLCLSGDHVYHAGNYGHKVHMAITQACTKPMADGAQCGVKHAYTGPLKSPCREVEGADRG